MLVEIISSVIYEADTVLQNVCIFEGLNLHTIK